MFDHARFIEYGPREPIELDWADDLEDQVGQLKDENIIFVLKQGESEDQGYVVFSLTNETKVSYGKLSCLLAPRLPEDILQRHLLREIPDHLNSGGGRDVTVVVSTHSGLCRAEEFFMGVVRPLLAAVGLTPRLSGDEAKEHGYEVIVTQSDKTIKDLGKRLQQESAGCSTAVKRSILLLTGDGGIVDLLNGSDSDSPLLSPKPTIILLPMGTGNALFHSLHKPLYTSTSSHHHAIALRTLFRGVPAPLPVFEASFSSGARLITYSDPSSESNGEAEEHTRAVSRLLGGIVASYGFHASLVWESDTPAYRKHGDKRFGMAAEELLKVGHGYDALVQIRKKEDGEEEWETPSFMEKGRKIGYALTTMVSNLEKTFTISPASRPLDGKLRLVGFGDVGGEKTLDVMKAAYNDGAHVGMRWNGEQGREETVGYEEVEEVRVTVRETDGRWRKVCVDGTIVELPTDGWMSIQRAEERFDVVVDRSLV